MSNGIERPWQTFALVTGGSFLGSLTAALLLWWLCGCQCVSSLIHSLPGK